MEPERRSEIEGNPTPLTSAKMLDSSGLMDKDTINIKVTAIFESGYLVTVFPSGTGWPEGGGPPMAFLHN